MADQRASCLERSRGLRGDRFAGSRETKGIERARASSTRKTRSHRHAVTFGQTNGR